MVLKLSSKKMNKITPKNKHDLNICKELNNASDNQVLDNLNELLRWTKDMNWPIAQCILDRISKLDIDILSKLITSILESDDSIWKYNILTFLLPNIDSSIISKIKKPLKKISENPTIDDIDEEVDIITYSLLKLLLDKNKGIN